MARCRDGLRKLLDKCAYLRSDLHDIKTITFKSKRKMDMNIKSIKDMIRVTSRNTQQKSMLGSVMEASDDKENNSFSSNRLLSIEVGLPKLEEKKNHFEHDSKLSEKIMLQLQEIKLIEQRENLIRKKNERMTNYYS